MDLTAIPPGATTPAPFARNMRSFSIEGAADCRIHIIERQGWIEVTINPTDRDYIFTLETQEFAFAPNQARIRVRGHDMRKDPPEMVALARTEVANLRERFEHGGGRTTREDVVRRLQALEDFLRGLLA